MSPETTSGPVAGLKKIPKPVLFGGIAVIGVGGFLWYRRQAAKSSAAATGTDTGIDPSTGLPYAQEASGFSAADAGTGAGYYGANVPPNLPTVPTFNTNSDWEQQAIADLANSGYTTNVAGLAISRVLAGLTVSTAQEAIFLQAVGLEGPRPGGYPTPIKVQGNATEPGGTKAVRHVATGFRSLRDVAHDRGTEVSHLEEVSRAHLNPANKTRFNKYVQGGTGKKMPPGLVYYTSN